ATISYTGTMAYINAALNVLTYATIANSNGAASVQITTNDLGNTGSGGSLSDTDAIAVTVNAVNDAPVNTVPGAQSTSEDTPLIFSVAGGNAITVADLDANEGTGLVRVTLTATNGTLTLADLTGLTFTVGDGTADVTITFTGTINDVNNAM